MADLLALGLDENTHLVELGSCLQSLVIVQVLL